MKSYKLFLEAKKLSTVSDYDWWKDNKDKPLDKQIQSIKKHTVVNIQNLFRYSVLDKKFNFTEYLIDNYKNDIKIERCSFGLPIDLFKKLYDNPLESIKKAENDNELISYLYINCSSEIMKYLIDKGFRIDEKYLGQVCFSANLDLLKYLVEKIKVNINKTKENYYSKNIENLIDSTILGMNNHYDKSYDVIEYLIQKGIKVTDYNKYNLISSVHTPITKKLNDIYILMHEKNPELSVSFLKNGNSNYVNIIFLLWGRKMYDALEYIIKSEKNPGSLLHYFNNFLNNNDKYDDEHRNIGYELAFEILKRNNFNLMDHDYYKHLLFNTKNSEEYWIKKLKENPELYIYIKNFISKSLRMKIGDFNTIKDIIKQDEWS